MIDITQELTQDLIAACIFPKILARMNILLASDPQIYHALTDDSNMGREYDLIFKYTSDKRLAWFHTDRYLILKQDDVTEDSICGMVYHPIYLHRTSHDSLVIDAYDHWIGLQEVGEMRLKYTQRADWAFGFQLTQIDFDGKKYRL